MQRIQLFVQKWLSVQYNISEIFGKFSEVFTKIWQTCAQFIASPKMDNKFKIAFGFLIQKNISRFLYDNIKLKIDAVFQSSIIKSRKKNYAQTLIYVLFSERFYRIESEISQEGYGTAGRKRSQRK